MKNAADLEIASVVNLTKAAKLYSSSIFSELTHQSLPIPVVANEGTYMAYLYCHAEILEAREGLQLWAPSHLAYVDANTCEFSKIVAVNPGVFNLGDAVDTPVGSYLTPPEQNSDKFLTSMVRLMQVYDEVITSFLRGEDPQLPKILEQRKNFSGLFAKVSERCLRSYYFAVSQPFFDWVRVSSGVK